MWTNKKSELDISLNQGKLLIVLRQCWNINSFLEH